jgi:hypothetical protein
LANYSWIENCRRDLLDHVIPINEQHLKRLPSDYVRYYHDDRTHLGLEKETPGRRSLVQSRVTYFLVSDSAACIIGTSGLPDPVWLFTFILIYVLDVRTCAFPPKRMWALRSMQAAHGLPFPRYRDRDPGCFPRG